MESAPLLSPAVCVGARQVRQTEFHTRHCRDLLSFWQQRALDATMMPSDCVRALELRPRAVKRIMRAAVDEIVNQGSERGACRTGEQPADSHPAGASRMTPPATRPRASEQVLPSAQSAVAEVNSGRAQARFCIEDEACFVMARACELFAMDLARRGELVVQDCRSEAKGPSQAAVTAKLKERHIVAAIECTDYCDFLVDLFHDAER